MKKSNLLFALAGWMLNATAQPTISPLPSSNIFMNTELEASDVYAGNGCSPITTDGDLNDQLTPYNTNGAMGRSGYASAVLGVGSGQFGLSCYTKASGGAVVNARQVDANTIQLSVNVHSFTEQECPVADQCDWYASALSMLQGQVPLLISGLSAGEPFAVSYSGRAVSFVSCMHENILLEEDAVHVTSPNGFVGFSGNSLYLQSNTAQVLFDYETNEVADMNLMTPELNNYVLGIGEKTALIETPIGHAGTSNGVGDTVIFHFDVETFAYISDPGVSINPAFSSIADRSEAYFQFELTIRVMQLSAALNSANPALGPNGGYGFPSNEGEYPELPNYMTDNFPPPPYELDCNPTTLFSIDIASDKELSDPNNDGNEDMDAGDIYTTSGTDGITALHFDDAALNGGSDPAPNSSSVPSVCDVNAMNFSNDVTSVSASYFDMDGFDYLDVDLSNHNFGPFGDGVIEYTSMMESQCIHRPDHIMVSFDDDPIHAWQGNNGASGTIDICDVPINPGYPMGLATQHDEIFAGYTQRTPTGFADGLHTMILAPAFSESEFAPSLIPDPTPVGPQLQPSPKNDDVDGLDIAATSLCDILYFSVDHEARSVDGLQSLDPGTIYQFDAGTGNIIPVIEPGDYGLFNGVDLNAFEFAWISTDNWPNGVLGIVFSLDADDEWTFSANETGGTIRSYNVLYYSILQGDIGVFTDSLLYVPSTDSTFPYNHNIDALAFSCQQIPSLAVVESYSIGIDLTITGIDDEPVALNAGIAAYPNPVVGPLSVKADEISDYYVEIYDSRGRLVFRTSMQQYLQIATKNLAEGMNIIHVTDLGIREKTVFRVVKP